jgi:hypothetical protein
MICLVIVFLVEAAAGILGFIFYDKVCSTPGPADIFYTQ